MIELEPMSPDDLLSKLHDRPFKPFRLRLSTNETIDLQNPNLVIVGISSAIVPIRVSKTHEGFELVERWKTVSLDHIVTFEDIENRALGNGRKRAKK